jgi:hypothetical protein
MQVIEMMIAMSILDVAVVPWIQLVAWFTDYCVHSDAEPRSPLRRGGTGSHVRSQNDL